MEGVFINYKYIDLGGRRMVSKSRFEILTFANPDWKGRSIQVGSNTYLMAIGPKDNCSKGDIINLYERLNK